MSQFKTKEFKALEAKWDAKLKKSGFEDIEQREDGNLKVWHSLFFKVRCKGNVSQQSKEEYYRLAGQFLNDYAFENETDRRIWELHSNGDGVRTIAATISKRKRNKTSKSVVNSVIRRLAAEMIAKCPKLIKKI